MWVYNDDFQFTQQSYCIDSGWEAGSVLSLSKCDVGSGSQVSFSLHPNALIYILSYSKTRL